MDTFTYNDKTVRRVNRIERMLVAHPLAMQDECCLVALCNALETQVEQGIPHRPTVALLIQAVLTYGASRGIDVDGTGIATTLKRLMEHIEGAYPA